MKEGIQPTRESAQFKRSEELIWSPIPDELWEELCKKDPRFCKERSPYVRENVWVFNKTRTLCLKTKSAYYEIAY